MRFKGNNLLYFVPDFTVIDLETTGRKNEYPEITELSAVRYRNFKPVDSLRTLVKAQNPILPFVRTLTGINEKMLKDAPRVEAVIGDFVAFLKDDIIVGHNVNFDLNLVYDAYYAVYKKHVSNDYTDTVNLARMMVHDSENHKLETLCVYFGIERVQGHRGLPDCEQTGSLYTHLMNLAFRDGTLHVVGAKHERI